MTYQEQLKNPKWQKKRLEILERDKFKCVCCGDEETTLHVHHIRYIKGKKAWDYEDYLLTTLCEDCHKIYHEFSYLKDVTLLNCDNRLLNSKYQSIRIYCSTYDNIIIFYDTENNKIMYLKGLEVVFLFDSIMKIAKAAMFDCVASDF